MFVPYVDTECLTANGKLAEQLRLCKGTTDEPVTFHDFTRPLYGSYLKKKIVLAGIIYLTKPQPAHGISKRITPTDTRGLPIPK